MHDVHRIITENNAIKNRLIINRINNAIYGIYSIYLRLKEIYQTLKYYENPIVTTLNRKFTKTDRAIGRSAALGAEQPVYWSGFCGP